jgi:ATP-dependent helicase/nuclease subunit B
MAATGGGEATRIFVGALEPWSDSIRELRAVARVQSGELDMGAVTVIVPGGRARRHLLRLLAEQAAREGLRLVPPRVVLPGSAEEALRQPLVGAPPVASEEAVALAWTRALDEAEPGDRAVLLPGGWQRFEHRLRHAASLAASHAEVEAACGGIEDVAREAAEIEGDPERYLALGRVAEAARRFLADVGFVTPSARQLALAALPTVEARAVFSLGVFDASPGLRRLLGELGDRLTVLVVADGRDSGRFDALGLARPGRADRDLPVAPLERVHVEGDPADQAEAAVRLLAAGADHGRIDADDVVLVLADETLSDPTLRVFAGRGLDVHLGRGAPLRRRPELRLLRRLAEHLREPSTRSLAALIQEPAFANLVQRRVGGDGFDPLCVVAAWRRDHPDMLLPEDEEEIPGADRAFPQLCANVSSLLAQLNGNVLLGDLARPTLDLLRSLYGDRPAEDAVGDGALVALRDQLAAWDAVDRSLMPRVPVAEGLAALAAVVGRGFVAVDPRQDEIEAIGWLELPLDPASSVIVVGCNDGSVPSRLDDPFFPDSLRRRVGMTDGRIRAARDAAVFAVACARGAEFVFGRRGPTQDPLQPSRFLLQGQGTELADRVLALIAEPESSVEVRPDRRSFARPEPSGEPLPRELWPVEMSVSSFKLYLQSPYHYWLQQVLRARPFELAGDELDARGIGIVLHAVLEGLPTSGVADLSDPEPIGNWLVARLDEVLAARAGAKRDAVLRIQELILAQRLRDFAVAQAGWVHEGWRISEVEWDLERVLEIPGSDPVRVRGKIDRVDRHADGRWRVIDYKTGDKETKPSPAHRSKAGVWRDLQLPLYRFLCEEELLRRGGASIETGYVSLSKGATVDFLDAAELDAEHDEAMAVARQVVQDVRAGRFDQSGDAFESGSLEFLCRSTALRGSEAEADEFEGGEEGA